MVFSKVDRMVRRTHSKRALPLKNSPNFVGACRNEMNATVCHDDSLNVSSDSPRDQRIFKNEHDDISSAAVERYFLQGKTVQMNRSRGGRKKKGKDSYQEKQASFPDDGEVSDDGRFNHCDLEELSDYFKISDSLLPDAVKHRIERISNSYPKWVVYLAAGFNILIYGVGSKRKVLSEFRDSELGPYCTLSIDGFREDVSIKAILSEIVGSLKLMNCEQKRRSVVEWATDIAKKIHSNDKQLIILLNNIDGINLRDPLAQSALLALAESEAVLLVATIDHVNATTLWNTRQLSSFNWLYVRIDTFAVPSKELRASQSRALGLSSESSQGAHSMTSLDILWQSLASNSRKIFHLFFASFFLKNEPVLFWDLFSSAKDNFLVSSDTTLRQQLGEFCDHRILRMKRADSGDDELVGLVERSLVEKFLIEKGFSLNID